MRRGYSYSTTFTIRDDEDELLSLSGTTAKYCIGTKEFDAVVENPGVVQVDLTSVQTATVPIGSQKAWCKVISGSDVQAYGEHKVAVK